MISHEHEKYLKAEAKRTTLLRFARIAILIAIIALWEVLARLNVIDAFIMSSPSRIVKTIVSLAKTKEHFGHIGITLLETLLGFAISMILGIIIAIILWWNNSLLKIFEPYLVILNSLPKIALGPILIIWCGAGMKAIVMMTILICIVITILAVLESFVSTDEDKILLMRSMGATKFQIFFKLVFPSSLPVIISTLKINVGLSFVGAIMGEYLVSKAGLGYLIVYGGQVFKLDLVMASTIILLILAGIIYYLVSLFEKLTIKYR